MFRSFYKLFSMVHVCSCFLSQACLTIKNHITVKIEEVNPSYIIWRAVVELLSEIP